MAAPDVLPEYVVNKNGKPTTVTLLSNGIQFVKTGIVLMGKRSNVKIPHNNIETIKIDEQTILVLGKKEDDTTKSISKIYTFTPNDKNQRDFENFKIAIEGNSNLNIKISEVAEGCQLSSKCTSDNYKYSLKTIKCRVEKGIPTNEHDSVLKIYNADLIDEPKNTKPLISFSSSTPGTCKNLCFSVIDSIYLSTSKVGNTPQSSLDPKNIDSNSKLYLHIITTQEKHYSFNLCYDTKSKTDKPLMTMYDEWNKDQPEDLVPLPPYSGTTPLNILLLFLWELEKVLALHFPSEPQQKYSECYDKLDNIFKKLYDLIFKTNPPTGGTRHRKRTIKRKNKNRKTKRKIRKYRKSSMKSTTRKRKRTKKISKKK